MTHEKLVEVVKQLAEEHNALEKRVSALAQRIEADDGLDAFLESARASNDPELIASVEALVAKKKAAR